MVEKFAKRLTDLRCENDISQKELAEKLNITQQSLSLYEKGERVINIELLERVCKFFNVSADYMLGLSDVPSYDVDKQAISKYLHLDEKTIDCIIGAQYEDTREVASDETLGFLGKSYKFLNESEFIFSLKYSAILNKFIQSALHRDGYSIIAQLSTISDLSKEIVNEIKVEREKGTRTPSLKSFCNSTYLDACKYEFIKTAELLIEDFCYSYLDEFSKDSK